MRKFTKALAAFFLGLFGVVAASCEFLGNTPEKTPTETPVVTPTEEEISQELKNARNYIKSIYQTSEGNVTSNLDRAAKLPVFGVEYQVDWAVSVTSGKADAVSVAKAEDGSKYVVTVVYNQEITEEVVFVLTATITAPNGETTTQSFNHVIPVFQANTVGQFLSEKDENKVYFLEGVITAVNKVSGKTAFVLSDATGSVFCYAGLDVQVGQKVQVTGNYGENASYPQIVNPALVKVLAENQDVEAASGEALVTTVEEINAAAKADGVTAEDLATAYKGKYLEITGYVVLSSTGYANFAVAADAASCCNLYANEDINSKQYVGAKVVLKGFARGVSVGNGLTIQVQSIKLAPGESMPEQPTDKFVEPAVTNKTLAEIIAMNDADNMKAAYTVTATVSKLGQKDDQTTAGAYGNLWVGEGAEKILVYGATATKTALAWDETTGKYVYTNAKDFDTNELTKDIKVGDKLQLLVVRSAYNGTPQLMVIVLAVNPEEVTYASKTVAELKAIPAENEMKEAYILTTKVTKLGQKDEQTTAGIYGNLWVGEGEDTILVYGATATASALVFDVTTGVYKYTNAKDYEAIAFTNNIKVGDTVELLVVKTNYKGTAQVNAIVLKVNGTAYTPVETPEEPEPTPTPEVPAEDVTVDVTNGLLIEAYADANAWANSVLYSSIKYDANTTISVVSTPVGNYGANTGKYYTNGENWRIYQNENPQVTIKSTKTIASVVVEYVIKNTGILTVNGTNYESGATISVNGNTLLFSVGNTGTVSNGNIQITKITVVYAE